ncbi:hypothetical protein DB346_05095 [Verrucomicrobia bacterium LW23]|nr:hypothetical protein DB346_05095 [Verrucomicrobia bacterium LW23]
MLPQAAMAGRENVLMPFVQFWQRSQCYFAEKEEFVWKSGRRTARMQQVQVLTSHKYRTKRP